ncbi:MAG: proline dehydrogenase family protein [Planctomycetota bacterium]
MAEGRHPMPADARLQPMTWFDSLAASLIPLVPKAIMRKFSLRYIAGELREDALRRGAQLAAAGYRVTYDQLGEAVSDQKEVNAAMKENLALLQDLADEQQELNISVKPTQMGLDLSEQVCIDSVSAILEKAQSLNAFVRFEMEESDTVDGTLRVYEVLRQKFGATVGIVIQSMLLRTEEDAQRLVASDAPLNVRLVKGIYVEPEEIAYQDGNEVNQAYLRTLRILLEGGAFVGVASHDEVLIDGLKQLLKENPAWREQCEVQMLLGVREELRQAVRKDELPVRVYVPYGEAWYLYVVRRLKKNPKLARYAMLGMLKKQEKLN